MGYRVEGIGHAAWLWQWHTAGVNNHFSTCWKATARREKKRGSYLDVSLMDGCSTLLLSHVGQLQGSIINHMIVAGQMGEGPTTVVRSPCLLGTFRGLIVNVKHKLCDWLNKRWFGMTSAWRSRL
jgi:hypothetical protein